MNEVKLRQVILRHGSKKLIRAVDDGRIELNEAADLSLRLDKTEQNNVLKHNAWVADAHELVCDFCQNDADLGYRMEDLSVGYWEHSYDEGLSPRQALDRLVILMQGKPA